MQLSKQESNLEEKVNELCVVWGSENTHELLQRIKTDNDWHRTDCSIEVFLDELLHLILIGDMYTVDCVFDFYLRYKETLEFSLKSMRYATYYLKHSLIDEINSLSANFGIKLKWWQKLWAWIITKLEIIKAKILK